MKTLLVNMETEKKNLAQSSCVHVLQVSTITSNKVKVIKKKCLTFR